MGYTRISDTTQRVPHEQLENIEMSGYSSRYASNTNLYAPPVGPPPESPSGNRDSKACFASDQPPVKSWPVHSQQVFKITPLRAFIIFFDAVLASTPIMFIALALVAAKLDGNEVSAYGTHLHQTLLLSPTIFPVIFAALMGRCFKHLGLFLAERGTTLGRLEQLIGCQSLFSAIERQICLRSWSLIGLCLTLIWLLSPLGGQSALRLLDQESRAVASNDTFHYLNPMAMQDSMMMGASAINSGRSSFTSVFLAALLSSSKYGNTPMDLWSNVKLPAYRAIESSSSDEWKLVPNSTNTNITYGSLIGIPVAGRHSKGNSTFNIRGRQWDITCDSNQEMSRNASNFGANGKYTWKLNYTTSGGRYAKYPYPFSLKSLDGAGNYSVAHCEMTYEYFEASIACNGTSCATTAMRKLDLYSDGYTQDHDSFTRSNLIYNSMITLPTVDNYNVGDAGVRSSTNMERWMMNPDNFIGDINDNVDLYKLPPDVLATRLMIIWNTFFQSTFATTALGGTLPQNLTELTANGLALTFNDTAASISNPSPSVYRTNWKWFVALLVSSIVLQIAAYSGLVLKYITLAPDIIGYVSSLTLLNPYVPTPTGGTTLHGLERTSLLHDLPVRIGDVCADEPVGAIAFAKADEGRVGRLDRRRWYI